MSTKTHYFTGTCQWAKVYEPDEYNGEKKWKIDVFLGKPELKDLKETGVKLKVKEDDDGRKYVTFNRPMFKEIKGELKEFEPPKVLDKDLQPMTDLIGNGSTVTVKVQVYDAPNSPAGKGHRLEAIRVDNLIPYTADVQHEGEF